MEKIAFLTVFAFSLATIAPTDWVMTASGDPLTKSGVSSPLVRTENNFSNSQITVSNRDEHLTLFEWCLGASGGPTFTPPYQNIINSPIPRPFDDVSGGTVQAQHKKIWWWSYEVPSGTQTWQRGSETASRTYSAGINGELKNTQVPLTSGNPGGG
jgi:hypothetical protein